MMGPSNYNSQIYTSNRLTKVLKDTWARHGSTDCNTKELKTTNSLEDVLSILPHFHIIECHIAFINNKVELHFLTLGHI